MNGKARTELDPLGGWRRSHHCGGLRAADVGREVLLMGWVQGRRDLGGLIFIDLRDREGITQIVFDPQVDKETHAKAHQLKDEWVVAVKGSVFPRLEGQERTDLPTGRIEVRVSELKILNSTGLLPFQVEGAVDASESLRLKYRYLELRRPRVFQNFRIRHRIAASIRGFLDRTGFVEVETPFLTKSTPEGARDYLVPSRISKGKFYALPQSPQLFKQLLMIAGFDRYYQIVRCFRDEDLRADRQPEFTQVDLEMAFVDENDVMDVFEQMMKAVFEEVLDYGLSLPLERLSYYEALNRFGTDRPDTRFGMELRDLTDIAAKADFKVFQKVAAEGGVVKGIKVEDAGDRFSRKVLDELSGEVTECGAKGLSWLKVTVNGWQSPLAKFFSTEDQSRLNDRFGASAGDLILIVADRTETVHRALGRLRLKVAERMGLLDGRKFALTWVTDFPLFEYDEDEGRLKAVHHPFTAPAEEDLSLIDSSPEKVRARAYDLVLNGSEIGGGSIRIHDLRLQEKMFGVLSIPSDEARNRFGFFLEALQYGAPPHGGMALGFDRLVALMAGVRSIREVIAFPKTTSATDLLSGAPDSIDALQLKELGLDLR